MIINDLPSTITNNLIDEIPVEQGTMTYKTTLEKVMDLFRNEGTITRPNILDNPWFIVNQRSQNSDYGVSQQSGGGFYSFVCDRWKCIALNGGGVSWGHQYHTITINATDASSYIDVYQVIPPNVTATLLSKTVTLSYSWAGSYSGYYATATTPDSVPSEWQEVCSIPIGTDGYVIFGIDRNGEGHVHIRASKGKTVNIDRVKLEVGKGSTLSMDTYPSFSQELINCQRFLYLLPSTNAADYVEALLWGCAVSSSLVRFYVKNPSKFYTTPTIVEPGYSGGVYFQLVDSDGTLCSINGFEINSLSYNGQAVVLQVRSSSTLVTNKLYYLKCVCAQANGGLAFSCEL